MALNIPGEEDTNGLNIFPHARSFDNGGGKIRSGAETVVVATDGSGDTDDIQEGIDMLESGGGTVYIKQGTYPITKTITVTNNDVELLGAGFGTKITTESNITMINMTTSVRASIRRLFLTGAGSVNVNNHGITITGTGRPVIERCVVNDCGGNGINLSGITDGLISGNMVIIAAGHGVLATNILNTILSRNHIIFNDLDGIRLTGGVGTESEHNLINSNVLHDNRDLGINILNANCDNNIITSNVVVDNIEGQIVDNGDGNIVEHNMIV